MAYVLQLTKMETGLPVMVSMYGIKMIEDTTYKPKPVAPIIPSAADGGETPKTTQPVTKAPPDILSEPVVCSMVWFHDDKTLVVKESMARIAQLAATPQA